MNTFLKILALVAGGILVAYLHIHYQIRINKGYVLLVLFAVIIIGVAFHLGFPKDSKKIKTKNKEGSKALSTEVKIFLLIAILNFMLIPLGYWLHSHSLYNRLDFYILHLSFDIALAMLISLVFYLNTRKYMEYLAKLPVIYDEETLRNTLEKPVRKNYLVINSQYSCEYFLDPNQLLKGKYIYINYQPQIYITKNALKSPKWQNIFVNNEAVKITHKAREITILDNFKYFLQGSQIGNLKNLSLTQYNFKCNTPTGYFDKTYYYPNGKKIKEKDYRYSVKTIPYDSELSYMAQIGAGKFEIKPILAKDLLRDEELFYFNVDEDFLRKGLFKSYTRNKLIAIWVVCSLSWLICSIILAKL